MSATDREMAPQAVAKALRRKDDARIVYQAWLRANAVTLAERRDDLAKGIRTFVLQQAQEWARRDPDRRENFEISRETWARFRKQWTCQTRRLRFGSVEGVTEAEWRAQMAQIEAEYWPKENREAA